MSDQAFVPAMRRKRKLWLGLYGPPGAGKTFSGLRVAQGMVSVLGGAIGGIDTEAGRMLDYAPAYGEPAHSGVFQFLHYQLDPPFRPARYLDALQKAADQGVTVAIVDSGSHEHEGPGGVLEWHGEEVERLSTRWKVSPERMLQSGWIEPKRQRWLMIDGAMRLPLHIIWCFRGKEKQEFKRGKQPVDLGYMPVGGAELYFAMSALALLEPGASGVPTWLSKDKGLAIKTPGWIRGLVRSGVPLDEEFGISLARWAQGGILTPQLYADCSTLEDFAILEEMRRDRWKGLPPGEKTALKAASEEAAARLEGPTQNERTSP